MNAEQKRQNGKVKFYNANKGFGFITRDVGEDLFFHATDIEGAKTLADGQEVSFEVGPGKKGDKAFNVRAN